MSYDLTVPILETARKRRPSGKRWHTFVKESGIEINYYSMPYSGKQPINEGRLEVWPDIELCDYTFSAVVDWIRISFDTTSRHKASNIHRWASAVVDLEQTLFVQRLDGEDWRAGHEFTLQLQNPTPSGLERLCAALETKYKIDRQAIRIDGIEVSLDIYPKSGSDEDRRRMTEVLRHHVIVPELFWNTPGAQPRCAFGDIFEVKIPKPVVLGSTGKHRDKSNAAAHDALTPEHFRDLDAAAFQPQPVDGTFYFGRKGDVAMVRIQDKVTDKRTGNHAQKLEQHRKRSRIEVTLDRFVMRELGVEFEVDIRNLPFDHLVSGVFATTIPTLSAAGETPDAEELPVFAKGGVLGLDRYQRAKHIQDQIEAGAGRGSRRPSALGIKGHGVAWAEFRKRSRKALKRLETQWGR
ncbi:hypothetical protein [Aliiruegeria lutimaris]|nr:hypothetical protein [Aliiruegeria lutimaris]